MVDQAVANLQKKLVKCKTARKALEARIDRHVSECLDYQKTIREQKNHIERLELRVDNLVVALMRIKGEDE